MKRIFISAFTLASIFSLAQIGKVGINTTDPKATLDINAKTDASTQPEGILIPRLTGDQIKAMPTTDLGESNMIYATSPATGSLEGKDVNLGAKGFFYWDGSLWQKVSGANGWGLTGNTGTDPATNFIGTTDDKNLVFKRNKIVAGHLSERGVALGKNTMPKMINSNGVGNTAVGADIMVRAENIDTGRVTDNTAIGWKAMYNVTDGIYNTAVGEFALFAGEKYINNTAVGAGALYSNNGGSNVAIGNSALYSATTTKNTTAIGFEALSAVVTGDYNIGIGSGLYSLGDGNVLSGSNNIIIGNGFSGGHSTIVPNAAASNQLSIGNAIIGLNVNDGVEDNDLIGIGTFAPTNRLHVKATADPIKLEGLQTSTTSTDKVVVADATGVLKTKDASGLTGNNWSLTGNAGTDPATNFIGTTDDKNLVFKRNNITAGVIGSGGPFDGSTPFGNHTSFGLGTMQVPSSISLEDTYKSSYYNSAFGAWAMRTFPEGSENSAFGSAAMHDFKKGRSNTVVGAMAMSGNVFGNDNTVVGARSLGSKTINTNNENISLSQNTVIGSGAMESATAAARNIAIGYGALRNITTGMSNIVLGSDDAGLGVVTGSGNILINGGVRNDISNFLNIGGTIFGLNLGNSSTSRIGISVPEPTERLDVDGNIRARGIYYNSSVTDTDKIVVADANGVLKTKDTGSFGNIYNTNGTISEARTVTVADAGSLVFQKPAGSTSTSEVVKVMGTVKSTAIDLNSDQRLKQDIKALENTQATLSTLRPVSYYWNTQGKAKGGNDKLQYGFIAQEVERVLPHLVNTDKEGYKSVNYIELIPVLTKALQQEQQKNQEQEERIKRLEQMVEQLIQNKK